MTNMKNDADRRTIYGRFAAMARRHPDAVAIIEDGRRLTDRGFAFLRRNDDQVMILGRRVETGEVENVLNESPDVARGVVRHFTDSKGLAYLVAYFVPKHGRGSLRVPSDGPHDAGPIVYREQARQDHFSGLGL